MNKKKHISIKNKIILVLLPIVIATYSLVCVLTVMQMNTELKGNLQKEMDLTSQIVDGEISTITNKTIGIIDNVKKSIENGKLDEASIKEYLYTVADAYPELIPTGIYCGLETGVYIDKTWVPDDPDWVMKERPWYVEGMKADDVTFGETYLDGETGSYIASVYTNIKNSAGNKIGVISADIPMDNIAKVTEERTLFENGYVYIVDGYSGLIFGNGREPDKNGKLLSDFEDGLSVKVAQDLADGNLGTIYECDGMYYNLQKVRDTNFVTVAVVPVADIMGVIQSYALRTILLSLAGLLVQSAAIYILMTVMLKPLSKISGMINKMYSLDMTETLQIKQRDEFGQIAEQLNELAVLLRNTITLCVESTDSLRQKAQNNMLGAENITETSEMQRQSVENFSATLKELSVTIEAIAKGATALAQNVNNVSRNVYSVNGKITETSVSAENGRDEMTQLKQNIQSVSVSSEELQHAIEDVKSGLQGINDMVTVIEGIASQTNLLSLNAGIEAARAGEMGRGFAVVADEIRALADNSSQSVQKITETTAKLESLIAVVMEKADTNIKLIEQSENGADRVDETFSVIRDNIAGIHSSSDEIEREVRSVDSIASDMAATTQEQMASIDVVVNTCDQMMDKAKAVLSNAEDLDATGKDLNAISENLKAQVNKFKV